MQIHTSRLRTLTNKNANKLRSVLYACAEPPAIYIWIGAFLLVRPHLLTPANELRITVQAIGDEIQDIFLGSLIHKRPHRVEPLEQTCIQP